MKCTFVPALMLAALASAALAQSDNGLRHSGAAGGRTAESQTAAAAATPAQRTIAFAGQNWTVKNSAGALWGPGPNRFSDAESNVWVDAAGKLHLAITKVGTGWQCAEIISQASFGYGTYTFTIESELSTLDPNVVLGLFTWNDNRAYNHREIDIEFARWGNAGNPYNAQYTVQPYTTNGNQRAWLLQPGYGAAAHSFRWTRDRIDFASTTQGNTTLQQWSYTRRNGIPRPGGENARLNLWLFNGAAPLNGQAVEIIVSGFSFTP